MSVEDFPEPWQKKLADIETACGVEIEALTVTENGTYSEEGKAYSPVTVNVSGGGSSDFSFAEVTLNITPPEYIELDYEIIQAKFEYPSDSPSYECMCETTNQKVNIILYHGAARIEESILGYWGWNEYLLDIGTMTTSGNIEYVDDHFIVTGNGTISGSYISQD